MNTPGLLLFTVFVLAPYGLEQLAYIRFTSNPKAVEHRRTAKVIHGYGLAYLWDVAHFSVLVGAGFRFIGTETPFRWWGWAGCLLFLSGVALRIWALRELGVSYEARLVIYPEHRIVTSGPYRLLRHPLHWGTTAQILGLALITPVWLGLPATLTAILLTLYFNRLEEQILLEYLGPKYEEYYARTWDMIDLIYRKRSPQP
ncbi:MAG TPA: isoprenylcysteine carboxylmethyltransferase family protein [Anaerolineales bacterium]|nr:isoprenylcysteine carboxylmethyltransferase family protein [Anaerolineales bacterium]